MVITTTATVLIIFALSAERLNALTIAPERPSAKLSAAKAEPRKPARVIPI